MGKYHEAADVLTREANRTKALMAAADALLEIGSLDQAASEASIAADTAKAALDKAKADLTVALAEVDSAKAKAAQVIAEANDKAQGIIADANGEADHIKAQAIDAAKAEGDAVAEAAAAQLANIQAQIATSTAKLTALDDAFGEATDRAERMTKAADDAEARLAKVKAQISALATV